MLAVKIIGLMFLALAVGAALYMRLTKPHNRYRRSARKKRQRMVVGVGVFFVIMLIFIVLLAINGDIFSDLVTGYKF